MKKSIESSCCLDGAVLCNTASQQVDVQVATKLHECYFFVGMLLVGTGHTTGNDGEGLAAKGKGECALVPPMGMVDVCNLPQYKNI